MEPRLLTLQDVASYLNVSTSQAYALVRSGELPAIKLGGRGVWRVDRHQLDAYIDRLHEETAEWAVWASGAVVRDRGRCLQEGGD
jgi:excisionase family DNA binding protein